ncbi:hypothetical protein [Ideonella paludis]|uniref:hypothetical protein n=1 Tax=Ideonella paludis TaxID=1233411 RepID=UPI00362C9D8C
MEMQFKLRVQDLPGSHGAPRAFSPWSIYRSSDGASVEELLFAGQTDADGNLVLSGPEEERLAQAYAATPCSLWIKTLGHSRKLDIAFERSHWTSADKAIEALAAMDYLAEAGPHSATRADRVVGADTGHSGYPLWNELKNR